MKVDKTKLNGMFLDETKTKFRFLGFVKYRTFTTV
jgi:hypothetical protein